MALLIIIFILVAYVLVLTYLGYHIAFEAPERQGGDAPTLPQGAQYDKYRDAIARSVQEIMERSYEEVSIISFDGLKLAGKYYHVAEGAPLQIQFHGYKSCAFGDLCGGTNLAIELGYNALVVDQRAHGKSEGATISFGVNERRDVLSWIEYALDRFGADTKIILVGISMGAATVLMSADLKLPVNVKGIMADCPYSSPRDIIRKVGKEWHFPPGFMYPFVKAGARLFGKFDLEESSAAEAVAKTDLPILLIHGEADTFVPCDMSHAIKEAGGENVELHTFPEASHGMSYMVDAKRYEKVATEFFERVIKGDANENIIRVGFGRDAVKYPG